MEHLTTPCEQCGQTGLPILFLRYAAAYSATSEGRALLDTLKPDGMLQAQPNKVAIKTTKYNVRMLRGGYLYLRLESPNRLPEWLAFAVHPHGYLTKIDVSYPTKTKAVVACKPDVWGSNRCLVWIKDAVNITKLHFMFHPDPIDPEHLKSVINGEPDKYMQIFMVSAWSKGLTAQTDTMVPAQLATKVLEFKAISATALEAVAMEQVFGLMGCNPKERGWGDWEESKHVMEDFNVAGGRGAHWVLKAIKHTQPTYSEVHAQRLKKMVQFLAENNGAVVTCEDPIGIAQEISMHHLTAAIPYAAWLEEVDHRGNSNRFKQAASASIATIRLGFQKAAMATYDKRTAATRRDAENILFNPAATSGRIYKVPMQDGSVNEMTRQEYSRYVREKWLKEANARDHVRAQANKQAGEDAVRKTNALIDIPSLEAFNKLHRTKIQARDDLLDTISVDLQLWLKSDGFLVKALGRYNQAANPAINPDGLYCAGQLCAILMQMEASPRGRQWYASIKTFEPAPQNLVWRILSFNNKIVSAEMEKALRQAIDPLPYGDKQVEGAQEEKEQEKALAKFGKILMFLPNLIKGADAIGKAQDKMLDQLSQAWLERGLAFFNIGKAASDNMLSVLLVSVLAGVKELPLSGVESNVARGQVLLLAHGLGSNAQRFAESDMTVAIKDKRMPLVLGGLNMLAILPKLGTAVVKGDARAISDALASVADAIGAVKGWRAEFFNEIVMKQLPTLMTVGSVASKPGVEALRLSSLKLSAAKFVVAGAGVGVWWDAMDALTAYEEKDILWVAYLVRVGTGLHAIGTTVAGLGAPEAVIAILARVNIYVTISALAATFIIAKLEGKAWINWLLAQPFRVTQVRDIDKNEFLAQMEDAANAVLPTIKLVATEATRVVAASRGALIPPAVKTAPFYPASAPESQVLKDNHKTPFKNEDEMMGKLSDCF